MNIADRHQEYELEIKALFARHRVSFTADLDGGAFRGTASGSLSMNIADRHQEYELEIKARIARLSLPC